MGARGPDKKPTEAKRRAGNPGGKALPDPESVVELGAGGVRPGADRAVAGSGRCGSGRVGSGVAGGMAVVGAVGCARRCSGTAKRWTIW
jgi:hypothetical protein